MFYKVLASVEKSLDRIQWEKMIMGALQILVLIVIAWVLHKVIIGALRRTEQKLVDLQPNPEEDKRIQTLMRLLRQAVRIVIWGVVGIMVLKRVGLDVAPVLASAGVVGLAVGFGAQNLVRDVISGLFLILENQVRVGDSLRVGDVVGTVERIGLRTISIRDVRGVLHILPNGGIDRVSNLTYEWSAFVFDIGVAYRADVDQVMDILRRVGDVLKADPQFGALMIEGVEVFGVEQFADSAIIIRGRIKTVPGKQWEVGRRFLRDVKIAFDREGIEIPFPQRVLSISPESFQLIKQHLRSDNG